MGGKHIKDTQEHVGTNPGYFKLPDFNFNAEDYPLLAKWGETTVLMAIYDLSAAEIQNSLEQCSTSKLKFPCHTKAVERFVELALLTAATDKD